MTADWAPPDVPNLSDIDRQRLSQVWFAGMHSDVGGGYAQDGLSHVALDWMMDRAAVYGLLFKPDERTRLHDLADTFDKLNDSRRGLGGYYRYKPRKLVDVYGLDSVKPTIKRDLQRVARTVGPAREALAGGSPIKPIIHESVFHRVVANLDAYSPIVLPEVYRVTNQAGDIREHVYEHPTQASRRSRRQERAWNWVWLRRVTYFATVLASSFLVAIPLIVGRRGASGEESRAAFLIPALEVLGGFMPALAQPWLDSFREAPGLFAVTAALVAVLLFCGGVLQRRIGDVMLDVWHPAVQPPPQPVNPGPPPGGLLYRLRTSQVYRGFFYGLTNWILPTAFAVLIVGVGLWGAYRLFGAVARSVGLI